MVTDSGQALAQWKSTGRELKEHKRILQINNCSSVRQYLDVPEPTQILPTWQMISVQCATKVEALTASQLHGFIYGQSRDGTGLLYACLSWPITVQETPAEGADVGMVLVKSWELSFCAGIRLSMCWREPSHRRALMQTGSSMLASSASL
jgi:hypothetical protein